ncbi:MAG: AAC(3) family N-acetyltransferase [Armatimonadota bacterium]|nr:AAC(3) family N-acetyltransferase [Armatimonadota bacterium]
MPSITKNDIITGLRNLGLKPGDAVLTHSSLSSFGYVDGGADAVIDAIIESVSQGGTVLFPTLTGNENLSPDNPPVFDVANTPCWTGLIPETARKRQDFIRSAHPTHSVCASGKEAERFIESHEFSPTPCGEGSPYDKLVEAGGYILLIGVGHECNTTMHYCEEMAGVPYHLQEKEAYAMVRYPDGRTADVPVRLHKYGIPRNFARLEPEFLANGIQTEGRIGESIIKLVKANKMAEMVLAYLRKDPFFLVTKDAGR